MALITYILIAIPVCLLAIILWLYFNYWKYKRKNHFILLILLFYPVLSYAEVTKRVYFIGNERMLIAHDSNRLRFS